MPTGKEIKAELDRLGIEYSYRLKKAELEDLLYRKTIGVVKKPGQRIAFGIEFTDPNADSVTQA